jgi:hypothetical protein
VGGGRRLKASWLASRGVLVFHLVYFRRFINFELRFHAKDFVFVIIKPFGGSFCC